MLGVGFDDLRQRDVRRRQRRLVGVATVSLAIASITIVLAIYAWIARNEAQERRAQAEDLIDFMLGDLREQLHEIGRLDVFESVGDKALEYFTRQDPDQESDRSLAQRARNLRQIGEVRREQGDLDAAMEAFNQSLRYADQMARRAPQDPEANLSMANSLFYLGYIHWQRGELAEARGIFESIIPIVDGVSALDPDNPDWLVERAYANTNLGRLLELDQRNERGAHEELVSHRVQHGAGCRDGLGAAGYNSVKGVSEGGQQKNPKPPVLLVGNFGQQDNHEQRYEENPQKGQQVGHIPHRQLPCRTATVLCPISDSLPYRAPT
jgi:tetratricopeptide (TPR) repeat protein